MCHIHSWRCVQGNLVLWQRWVPGEPLMLSILGRSVSWCSLPDWICLQLDLDQGNVVQFGSSLACLSTRWTIWSTWWMVALSIMTTDLGLKGFRWGSKTILTNLVKRSPFIVPSAINTSWIPAVDITTVLLYIWCLWLKSSAHRLECPPHQRWLSMLRQ